MNKLLKTILLVIGLSTPGTAISGPASPACAYLCCGLQTTCIAGCTVGFVLPLYYLCVAGCTTASMACVVACAGSCFAEGTTIIVRDNGEEIERDVKDIKTGDVVLTLQNKEKIWTKVLKAVPSQGEFKFIKITAKDLEDGLQKQIVVTAEHGLILLGDGNMTTIDSAENLLVGDRMIGLGGHDLLVTDVEHMILFEKYSIETAAGTIVASSMLVSTICGEEIAGGEKNFEKKMHDWKLQHNF